MGKLHYKDKRRMGNVRAMKRYNGQFRFQTPMCSKNMNAWRHCRIGLQKEWQQTRIETAKTNQKKEFLTETE